MSARNSAPQSQLAPEFDAALYWEIIKEHRKKILTVTAVCFSVSLIAMALIPNTYEAEVQIAVLRTPGAEQINPQSTNDQFRGESEYYGTQAAVISNRSLTSRVEEDLGVPPDTYKVEAEHLRGTQIILVTVRSHDRDAVAPFANRLVQIYIKEKAKDSLFMARQMLKWLPTEQEEEASVGAADSLDLMQKSEDNARKEEVLNLFSAAAKDPLYQQLKNERQALEAEIKELSFRLKEGHPSMLAAQEKLRFVDEKLKTQRAKLIENLRQSLTGQYQLTNIKVINAAEPPKKPVSKRAVPWMLLSTLGGLVGSSMTLIYLDRLYKKIRFREDLELCGGAAYLGAVPKFDEMTQPKGVRADGNVSGVPLTHFFKTNTLLADAVVKLRTHILFSAPQDTTKTMMVTSTIPNEGKSTVATLLALAFANAEKKTLLIDADLRRPFIHVCLGVDNRKGLHEYLMGQATTDEIIREVPGTSLGLIPAGLSMGNPSDLLASRKFAQLLDELREKFDRIIIDVPPVLYIPDGLILARYVDSSVLICRTGVVSCQALGELVEQFHAMRPHQMIGVIFNYVDPENQSLRYKHYRNYDNYYPGATGREAPDPETAFAKRRGDPVLKHLKKIIDWFS